MSVTVSRPRVGTLMLRKSRARAALELGVLSAFFSLWYLLLISGAPIRGSALVQVSCYALFGLLPLGAVPRAIRLFRRARRGEEYTLDRQTHLIEKNGETRAHFRDVKEVRITVIHDRDVADEHRLSILLTSGDRLGIHESRDAEEVSALAEEVADILEVKIVRCPD